MTIGMYGPILKHLRESRERSQADVARSVGISPAHLARLESNQRGLYVVDFVRIAEILGEKPGNLLPNDLGEIGHLKPLIDRLLSVPPAFLPRIATILTKILLLTEEVSATSTPPEIQNIKPRRKQPRKGKP